LSLKNSTTRLCINFSPRFIWAVNILIQLSQRRYIFWLLKMRYCHNIFHWWHFYKHHAVSTRYVLSLILVKQASFKPASSLKKTLLQIKILQSTRKLPFMHSKWHWLDCTYTKQLASAWGSRKCNRTGERKVMIDDCWLDLCHWLCDRCRSELIMRADLKDHMIAICMLLALVRVTPSDWFESNDQRFDLWIKDIEW